MGHPFGIPIFGEEALGESLFSRFIVYEGLDWKSDIVNEKARYSRIIHRGGKEERKIGVQICQRGYQAIQGEKENAGAIEIV